MEKKVVNWGVIGCGWIADSAVIPGINAACNARLYAVASRSGEKLEQYCKKHNPVKGYDSYEALLEDPEIDAVYIPLPNGLHCEWVCKAAEKKKHVLCEKPLGVTAEEVKVMKEACERNGVLLMEAFAYRHSPLTFELKKLVDQGVIGKLKFIESHFSFTMKDMNNVRLIQSLGGGATYDIGCYNINIIRYLAGSEPTAVFAAGETGEKTNVDESSCTMMEFKDGLNAVSYCSFNSIERCDYTIAGEAGIIEVPVQFNSKGDVRIILRRANEAEEINLSCPDNYMLEVEQFGRCILEGEKPLVSLEDSYNNAVVIDATLSQILKK